MSSLFLNCMTRLFAIPGFCRTRAFLVVYIHISAAKAWLHCSCYLFSARNTFPPATLPSYLQPPPYVGSWQNVNFPRTPQIPPPLSPVRPLLTCVTEHFRGDTVCLALNNAQGGLFGEIFFLLNWPTNQNMNCLIFVGLGGTQWSIGWGPLECLLVERVRTQYKCGVN